MKKSEVPQDKSSLDKVQVKELCYAVDDQGKYTTELSSGWEPKSIVQHETLKLLQERIEQSKLDVKDGLVSPIVYFMELHRMDWSTLGAYMNRWVWRIKRHAKPSVFKKLNQRTLQRYADIFDINVEELKNYKGD
ncbi:hypothetical protein [Flavobacterium sp. NKUCC04_CG]|uniref:hypothetical protein n=1 Tax=Flavobacterium sp. NKUCC04_CG TaxID=2842121 RepID=UPI001C5BCD77|nr:hypothetical protein [Flavobacterium sp. NKUCC04_CG]MBW3518394.1 hypothetical protein [Flavobacterium sp. NKUCC04_CG]